jgi:hypothetical protein
VCAEDLADFEKNPSSDGWPQLKSCTDRLVQDGAVWSHQNFSSAFSFAAWFAETAPRAAETLLAIACSLIDILWPALLVVVEWGGAALRLVCINVAAFLSTIADARPLDTMHEIASKITFFLQSVSLIIAERGGVLAAIADSVVECVMKEHDTTCLLTDPSLDAATQPKEIVWLRVVTVALVKVWNAMQVSFFLVLEGLTGRASDLDHTRLTKQYVMAGARPCQQSLSHDGACLGPTHGCEGGTRCVVPDMQCPAAASALLNAFALSAHAKEG